MRIARPQRTCFFVTVHLMKLCVGVASVDQLRRSMQARRERGEALRHRTRRAPRRAADLLDGGSLYWVIAGSMAVRQPLIDVVEDRRDDGSACCSLLLGPELIALEARATRPFQGWRYLEPAAAPPDAAARGEGDGLPAALRQELRSLCLI